MRIHRVEIAGFGPFRHKQVVDFDKFADDGLFLIAGKTGAGKTSILDAICFGLYGGAPRYDSIMGVTEKTYRSHFADRDDRTAVSVEFSTEDGRYRVERAPGYERPAVRRDGTVTVMPTAELSKAVDGAWITVASKPKLVDEALSPIRRLKREEFLQVMLLAQNRFQEFLVASTAERNQVLQTLFNTKRFEDYETLLKERRGKLAAALADSDNAVNRQLAQVKEFSADPDTQFPASPEGADRIPKLLAELTETERAKLTAAQQLAAAAAIAAETAQVEYDRRNETRKRQDQRASALAEIAELDSVTDAAQQWQQELRDAQRADVLMPLISAAEKARDTLATAMSATGQAAKSLGVFSLGAVDPELNVPAPGAANREAAAAERRLTEFAGSLGVAAEREAELPQLTTAAEVARQRLAEHDRESTARAQQLQDLDQLLQAAGGQQRECLTAAAALPAETERVARITAAIGAAVDAAEVSAQVVTQKAELAAKLGAVAAAEASVQELWRQRIAEYAGTLAAELIPGQPCPVCGAVEHPRPADPATEPVTEARLKRARKTAADLGNDAEEAAQLVGESERRLAELHARAEGKSAAEWERSGRSHRSQKRCCSRADKRDQPRRPDRRADGRVDSAQCQANRSRTGPRTTSAGTGNQRSRARRRHHADRPGQGTV